MTTPTACVLIAAMITVGGGLLAASYPFLARLANRRNNNPGNPGNPGINGKRLEDRLQAQEVLMAKVCEKVDNCVKGLDELKKSVGELFRQRRGI